MTPRKPKIGPCRNAIVEDGAVVVECPHGGTAPFVKLPWPVRGDRELRGLCDGCLRDADAADAAEDMRRRSDALDVLAGGPKMRGWNFETYPEDAVGLEAFAVGLRWLSEWRAGARRNLVLYGGVGGGKTGLAWCIIRDVVETDHTFDIEGKPDGLPDVGFVNFRDYLEEMKAAFGERREPDRRARSRTLLVLDDLGAERPTDFARNELASLVEHRYQHQLATIVTSNYALDELAERLGHDDPIIGQRIASRLIEDSVRFELVAPDRRLA
jgi:DNA replication protein DnaC